MTAIGRAVTRGRGGHTEAARRELLSIWDDIGVLGDPLHRCALAHYLADLHDDPAEALAWDIRAVDAAAAAGERHDHASVAGFGPSLHLNLADDYRRLGSFAAAATHLAAARAAGSSLPGDAYGQQLREWIDRVAERIAARDSAPLA